MQYRYILSERVVLRLVGMLIEARCKFSCEPNPITGECVLMVSEDDDGCSIVGAALLEGKRSATRIKVIDYLGNVSYVVKTEGGKVNCVLSGGTSASLHYAGISGDLSAARFALEDAKTPEDMLAVMKARGSSNCEYTLVSE